MGIGGESDELFAFGRSPWLCLKDTPLRSVLWDAAFSADGERVATVGGDGITRLFSLPAGQVLTEIDHGKPTEVLSFSPDGHFLFAGGQGTMHFLDAVTGAVLFSPTRVSRCSD